MEASVPVFGNCCLDLPVDSDGVSEDTVSIDADALVDSEAGVLALVDSEAGVLALVDSEAGVLALVETDSETDVLVEIDIDTDVETDVLRLADCEALSLKLKSGLSVLSGTDILVEVD